MSSTSRVKDSSRSSTTTSSTTTTASSATSPNTSAPDPNLTISSSRSRTKDGFNIWRDFQVVATRLFKNKKLYEDIEQIFEQHTVMETEIRTLKQRIFELDSNKRSHLDDFQTRYDEWKNEKAKLQQEKTSNQDAMNTLHQKETQELQKALASERRKTETLSQNLDRAKTETNLVKSELQLRMRQLQVWERYTGVLEDVDFTALQVELNKLFNRTHSLVTQHFGVALPSLPPRDETQWAKQAKHLVPSLSIPPTNSRAAQNIRVAAALHVLAISLEANIFKPCYIPETGAKTIKEILEHQVTADMRNEEQLIRATLLSMYPREQVQSAVSRAVDLTLEDVRHQLRLFLDDGIEAFVSELEPLLHCATQLARKMQHSKKMMSVSVEASQLPNDVGGFLEEFGALPAQTNSEKLILFPYVWLPEEKAIVHDGVFLWSEQDAFIDAETELKNLKAERNKKSVRNILPVSGVGSPTRERRMSVNMGGALKAG